LTILLTALQIVLHTASPLAFGGDSEDPERALVVPAVEGTTNVLNAIANSAPSVKVVVLTSSVASISSNAGLLPETHVYSEADWSPVERLRELKRW
jgi:nucleoside-diphosphate-sugar epimerase